MSNIGISLTGDDRQLLQILQQMEGHLKHINDVAQKAMRGTNAAAEQAAQAFRGVQQAAGGAAQAAAEASSAMSGYTVQSREARVEANLLRQANRQLSMQMTDVVTSLASGMPAWMVFIQQGGQIRDSYGGVGQALRGVGTYLRTLINPLTAAAAVLAAFGAAAFVGAREMDAYVKALTLSGNAAGVTAGALDQMAARIDNVAGTQGRAAEVLALIAANGDIGAASLERVAQAAIQLERAGGPAAEETVKQFAALGKDPVDASLKLNESTRFLTVSLYEQIKALQNQGRTAEAAAVAMAGYATTVEQRTGTLEGQLGYIERAWRAVKDGAKEAWDAMLGLGRQGSPEKQLADIQRRIAEVTTNQADARSDNRARYLPMLDALRLQEGLLQEQIRLQRKGLDVQHQQAEAVKARSEWDRAGNKLLTDAEKLEREIVEARRQGVAAGMSQEAIEKRIAAIRAANAPKASTQEMDAAAKATADALKAHDKYVESLVKGVAAATKENQALADQVAQVRLGQQAYAELLNVREEEQAVLLDLQAIRALDRNLDAKEYEALKAQAAAIRERINLRKALANATAEAADREIMARRSALKDQDALDIIDTERLKNSQSIIDAINREAEALQMSNIEREVAIALLAAEARGIKTGSYEYEEYAKNIRAAIVNRETVRASIAQTKTIEEEWRRTADQIGQSLTDALMTGGKSAWEYIKGLFRSMVLRPVIQAVVNPIVGATQAAVGSALGLSAGSAAAGTAFGNAAGAAIGSAIFGSSAAYGAAIGTTSVAAGSQAAMLAAQTGSFGAAGLTATSSAAAGAGSGFMATAAAAGPYVLAALAVLNAVGAFRSKKIVGGGLTGTLGEGDIQSYDLQRRGGTLFDGPDYSMVNQQVSAESRAIQTAYEALRTNAASMAESLGLSGDAVRSFTTQLGTDILHNDLSARGIKLDGLSPEEAAAKVQGALNQANEDLAAFVLGASRTVTETITSSVEDWAEGEQGSYLRGYLEQVTEVTRTIEATGVSYRREGETNVQTLQRLASSLATVNPALDVLGLNLYATSLAGADLASQLADAFGGLEAFGQAAASYYSEFYSEAERTAKTTEQLTKALGDMGLTLPATRDAYRQLVEAQDLNTEAGRKNFAALVQLSGTFAEITPVVEDLADAGENATETLRSAADILRERQGLERELLQLQGDTTALRALDRAALDASNQALFDQITALQDSQAAAAAAADAERSLAAERDRIAQERAGLERQLLELQGNTTALRALDRAALDASNRALYDQITALQDSQAATAAAAQAAQEAADAERALAAERDRIAQERAGLERQLLQLQGDTNALRALDRAALDASNRALFDHITALQDSQAATAAAAQAAQEAADAERALAAERDRIAQERAGLERQLLQLQGDTTALRALDRAALDESNRALFDQITALQDSQAAAAAAAQAQREYAQAVETAQANVERARAAVESAEAGVNAVREAGTSAYLSAQDRVAAAQARIAEINAQMANEARDAALRVRELGTSLQQFVTGEFSTPSQSFGALLRKALGGDTEAMQGLPEAARAAIDVSRSSARTSAQAAIERARILSSVAEVAAVAAATAVPAGAAEVNPMTAATAELAAAQAELADALSVANTIGAPLTRKVEDLLERFTAAQEVLAKAQTDYAAAQQVLADIKLNTGNTVTEVTKLQGLAAKAELEVQLKAVAESNLPDDIKALIADKGKTYTATITAVMDSALTDAEKTLLLEANSTGLRSVILSSAFKNVLTAQEQQALMAVDETVLRTIQAVVSTGTLTNDQKLLLQQQSETVRRTIQTLVDSSALTDEQKRILGLVTSSTSSTLTLSGTLTFDPSNSLQSIFNNISASNAMLARLVLSQVNPATSTVGQKASAYAGLRQMYSDADTRRIVEVQFGPQTNEAWAALKQAAGFATGGVFTNGLVTSATAFPMGVMGEAGPEAIMPLGRGADGSLGVQMLGNSTRRDEVLVAEIRALRAEVTELRAEARSTAVATNKTARILDRVTPDGNSLQTVAAA
jgi:phage-related minor tail protein